MLKSILPAIGGVFLGLASVLIIPLILDGASFDAQAEGHDLLNGCSDIPEAVELTIRLKERALRVDRFLQEVVRRKDEIKTAETDLRNVLENIVSERSKGGPQQRGKKELEDVEQDIARLISVYDQMKSEQAAGIMEKLPPEFSAEILMRMQPENSAKIISSINVSHAAVLTSYMGSRHARK